MYFLKDRLNLSSRWPKEFPKLSSWPVLCELVVNWASVCYWSTGLAMLALTLAWSTASSKFLLSMARVCEADSICFLHSSFREVMAFCWASRILLISSDMSLFSSFSVPSICSEEANVRKSMAPSAAYGRFYSVWDLAPPVGEPGNCRSWIPALNLYYLPKNVVETTVGNQGTTQIFPQLQSWTIALKYEIEVDYSCGGVGICVHMLLKAQ